MDRTRITVSLPELLVEHFVGLGADRSQLLGDALALGITDEARPPEAQVADSPDPEKRKAQAVTNLLHFFGRYWYLALTAARLQQKVGILEKTLEALGGPHPEADAADAARQMFLIPRLVVVHAMPFEADLDKARCHFVSDDTSDAAATAIAFGSGPLLLRSLTDSGSTDEILREIGTYWSGVATLQYRAYALGHDRQVLRFRLAAVRAETALRTRLSLESTRRSHDE